MTEDLKLTDPMSRKPHTKAWGFLEIESVKALEIFHEDINDETKNKILDNSEFFIIIDEI